MFGADLGRIAGQLAARSIRDFDRFFRASPGKVVVAFAVNGPSLRQNFVSGAMIACAPPTMVGDCRPRLHSIFSD